MTETITAPAKTKSYETRRLLVWAAGLWDSEIRVPKIRPAERGNAGGIP